MTLTVGTRLGTYEITGTLGAGGMGEVYRARDTRLRRDVALKVLPDSFASDPERLARFQREAEVLASLNHPNIAAIHGLEEADGVRALVLELVDGPTLAELIERQNPNSQIPTPKGTSRRSAGAHLDGTERSGQGPAPKAQSRKPGRGLPVAEALAIARQIAEALEAAHEQGIVHRDLKPANIKVRGDGTVKVLDFGLAKLAGGAGGSSSPAVALLSNSPTITSPALTTGIGTLLGTAAYMSPEQAKGREADRRSDIWAFGCVLFEMLTGRRAFDGEDVSDTLAAVLRAEPDFRVLPPGMSARMRDLLHRCLDKEPKRRWQAIGDIRYELERPHTSAAESQASPAGVQRRTVLLLAAAAAALAMIATAGILRYAGPADGNNAGPAVQFTIQPNRVFLNPGLTELAVSPDGRHIAFVAGGNGPERVLWVHAVASGKAWPLPQTQDATNPFWSPDGEFVAFYADGRLRKVPVTGGPAETIIEVAAGTAGTWRSDNAIVFGSRSTAGLFEVPAGGGTPVRLTTVEDSEGETAHLRPQFLPDGGHILYFVESPREERRGVYALRSDRTSARVLETDVHALYASPGYLLTVREELLVAIPFDTTSLTTRGDTIRIGTGAARSPFGGAAVGAGASMNGVLAFAGRGGRDVHLSWYDRTGRRLATIGDAAPIVQVRLSPDERRALLLRTDPASGTNDLWGLELSSEVSTKLSSVVSDPAWAPDGSRIAFSRTGRVFARDVGSGEERMLWDSGAAGGVNLEDWTRDGSAVVVRHQGATLLLPVAENSRPSQVLPPSTVQRNQFQLSPDGRRVAFTSDESGQTEVWVASFPAFEARTQVSNGGGFVPRWRKDQRELFYLAPDGRMMAADVDSGPSARIGRPRPLFQTRVVVDEGFDLYTVTGDGQRFLVLDKPESASVPPITVIANWTALLTP